VEPVGGQGVRAMERTGTGRAASLSTRRQLIGGAVFAAGGIALGAAAGFAGPAKDEEISRSAEAIHQEVVFKAWKKRVYEVLSERKEFDKVVRLSAAMQSETSLGSKPTEISKVAGGTFTIFGGHILGRHIELLPNERIVQAWRVVDWKPGMYSIAKFELTEQGSETKVVFDHTGFPKGLAERLAEGWRINYWEPMQKMLALS
jgi:activator of HSP90 ATPase